MLTGGGALLIDLDGVLYVEEDSIPGAVEAVERLRGRGLALALRDQHARALARADARQSSPALVSQSPTTSS